MRKLREAISDVVSASFLPLTCAWLFLNLSWAENIMKFWTALYPIAVLVGCLVVGKTKTAYESGDLDGWAGTMDALKRRRKRPVRRAVFAVMDVAVIVLLAASAHFWMAGIWTFSLYGEHVYLTWIDELKQLTEGEGE